MIKLRLKDTRGQAMTEFCVVAPLLVLFLYSVMYMSDMYVVKHKTLHAARYTAWLTARHGVIYPAQSAKDIYFKDLSFTDPGASDQVEITWYQKETTDFKDQFIDINDWGSSVKNHMPKIAEHLTGLGIPDPERSLFEVIYAVPTQIAGIDLTDLGGAHFKIKSSHLVGGNSWDGCRVHANNLSPVIEEVIEEELGGNPF